MIASSRSAAMDTYKYVMLPDVSESAFAVLVFPISTSSYFHSAFAAN